MNYFCYIFNINKSNANIANRRAFKRLGYFKSSLYSLLRYITYIANFKNAYIGFEAIYYSFNTLIKLCIICKALTILAILSL